MNDMKTVYKNGLTYKFEEQADGWIGIYLEHEETHELHPLIQAKDEKAAMAYIALRERVPFNVEFI